MFKNLAACLPREAIRNNLPKAFIKTDNNKCRVILDCAEVFFQRPKPWDGQAATWSDYKHHNTTKFLIGISPSVFITFLSLCYSGRASDKFITKDSAFCDLLEYDDVVIADRSFQIYEDLLLNFCNLQVPPGAQTKSQMTKKVVQKTKEIAILWIHVERTINGLKNCRILKGTLPITMMQHVDEIVVVCAALCNIEKVLIQTKKN